MGGGEGAAAVRRVRSQRRTIRVLPANFTGDRQGERKVGKTGLSGRKVMCMIHINGEEVRGRSMECIWKRQMHIKRLPLFCSSVEA